MKSKNTDLSADDRSVFFLIMLQGRGSKIVLLEGKHLCPK